MKISINWLKEFIKIDKKRAEKLADKLTFSGTEVEKVIENKENLKNMVVGEIITITKHSNADKLKVCRVRVKKGRILKIVCGASNIKVGQKVPVALSGSQLPDGTEIKETKIRGIKSQGMLLAEDEMAIGEDHSGIYILDEKEKVGKTMRQVLDLNDIILDLALTPNRSDCFSVYGIARELSAVLRRKLKKEAASYLIKDDKEEEIKDKLGVSIRAKNLCHYYSARIIKNIKVGPSPEKIKNRLRRAGIRPVNNVVDASNYVMLELGQPLHAFDYNKISGSKKKNIIVRKARKDEKLKTLDGLKRDLEKRMLVIADQEKPLALAGIMGGENSEIKSKTNTVVLESAVFKPSNIRITARKLGLRSESSNLFEKGLDSVMTRIALDRAANLIADLSGGEVIKGSLEKGEKVKAWGQKISLSLEKLRNILNKKIAVSRIKQIFTLLGFDFVEAVDGRIKVRPPSFRPDIKIPEDLIEEVGRLYDYNRLKPTYLKGQLKPVQLPKNLYWEDKIKNYLVSANMSEVYNYSFYSQEDIEAFDLKEEKHYRITNPINPDQEYLRQTLIPLMLKNISLNIDFSHEISIFETGYVFLPSEKNFPHEKKRLSGVFYGEEAYFSAKAALDLLMVKGLNIEQFIFDIEEEETILKSGEKKIGTLRILPGKIAKFYKIKKPVAYFEIDLTKLIKFASEVRDFEKPSEYPAVTRDLAFFMPEKVKYAQVEKEIKKASPIIKDIELFDTFKKEGKLSLAVRITFQSEKRTLKSKEIDSIIKKIVKSLEKKYNIKIRK
ncbi:MAG: phenylalanine--tRNA ligase subunit beta [Patescibacteria group bacterium]|nr:phenylalanine--tRNA ligase subunit beta [Patescibacteria group bacterium]